MQARQGIVPISPSYEKYPDPEEFIMISLYDDAEDKQIEMNEQFAISQNVSLLAPRRSVNIYLVHQNMFLFFFFYIFMVKRRSAVGQSFNYLTQRTEWKRVHWLNTRKEKVKQRKRTNTNGLYSTTNLNIEWVFNRQNDKNYIIRDRDLVGTYHLVIHTYGSAVVVVANVSMCVFVFR